VSPLAGPIVPDVRLPIEVSDEFDDILDEHVGVLVAETDLLQRWNA
jgi:hypothetical protein